jgi:hypothetical protein
MERMRSGETYLFAQIVKIITTIVDEMTDQDNLFAVYSRSLQTVE